MPSWPRSAWALYGFTAVLAIAAIADAKVVAFGAIAGTPRIARHLWRMCLGLTLAAGSSFTNGFARLLPGPCHKPIGFLLFLMIRVRSKSWR